jgi:uncharacterized protein (TIGR03083 family)
VGDLFRLERERLVDLLSGLSTDDWQRPTPCPDWTVLDLCNHLLGDDLGWLARHRDGYQGLVPAPDLDETGFASWLDGLQMTWVVGARRLSPQLVVELLHWSGAQVADGLAQQDNSAVTASVSWAGPQPVPVWLDQLRELSEQWIHRQQLLHGLGRPSDLRSDIAGPVLDGLRWAYPYRLQAVSARSGDTVTITVTGTVKRIWHLVAGQGGWRFSPEAGERCVATLDVTADEAWRLLTNNLPAEAQSALYLKGDTSVIVVLRRTRAIIGVPN